jgi:hypothetical protein
MSPISGYEPGAVGVKVSETVWPFASDWFCKVATAFGLAASLEALNGTDPSPEDVPGVATTAVSFVT